jgi:hypothetical protein
VRSSAFPEPGHLVEIAKTELEQFLDTLKAER